MKLIGVSGLAAFAATALLAFATSALATTFTAPFVGFNYTGPVKAESLGKVRMDNTLLQDECLSKLTWQVESHGPAGPVKGAVTSFSAYECAAFTTFTLLKTGSIEVDSYQVGRNGTLTWAGARMTLVTDLGFTIDCVYELEGPHVGVLTGSSGLMRATARLDFEARWKFVEGNPFCAKTTTWTGEYRISTPDYLDVD